MNRKMGKGGLLLALAMHGFFKSLPLELTESDILQTENANVFFCVFRTPLRIYSDMLAMLLVVCSIKTI